MNRKSLNLKSNSGSQSATVLGPGDFPIGSLESRAAARLRLQGFGGMGKDSAECICFPAEELPFFGYEVEKRVADSVKCPLHGDRFNSTLFHLFVPKWRRENEPLRRQRLSSQYHKAWDASFPPDRWPAQEVETAGKVMLRLKDGTLLETE